jgi:hypothetical protein
MIDLEASIDRIAEETGFSGVVRVDQGDDVEFVKANGSPIEVSRSRTQWIRDPGPPVGQIVLHLDEFIGW